MSDAPTTGATAPPKADPKPTLTRKLPSDRMSFTKQMDLLRAFAVLGASGEPVKLAAAAEMVKLHASNLSTMNPFLSENGFVTRDQGNYMPAPAVIEFGRAHTWNAATAPQKLLPLVEASWFGQLLKRKVAFAALPEEQAIEALALEASAGPEYRAQIRMLVDYAETVGLVKRENGNLYPTGIQADAPKPDSAKKTETSVAPAVSSQPKSGATGSPFLSADGAVSLQIAINVDLAELKGWPADRITAFFAGLAQVVAARETGRS